MRRLGNDNSSHLLDSQIFLYLDGHDFAQDNLPFRSIYQVNELFFYFPPFPDCNLLFKMFITQAKMH